MPNYFDLTGRVAIVTGASSGIGAATAEVMADLGARVAIGFHSNQTGADAVATRIRAAGGTALPLAVDVRESADINAFVAKAAADLAGRT